MGSQLLLYELRHNPVLRLLQVAEKTEFCDVLDYLCEHNGILLVPLSPSILGRRLSHDGDRIERVDVEFVGPGTMVMLLVERNISLEFMLAHAAIWREPVRKRRRGMKGRAVTLKWKVMWR